MKKQYIKPTMSVVKLQQQCQMLAGSVKNLSGNADLDLVGDDTGYDGFIR